MTEDEMVGWQHRLYGHELSHTGVIMPVCILNWFVSSSRR